MIIEDLPIIIIPEGRSYPNIRKDRLIVSFTIIDNELYIDNKTIKLDNENDLFNLVIGKQLVCVNRDPEDMIKIFERCLGGRNAVWAIVNSDYHSVNGTSRSIKSYGNNKDRMVFRQGKNDYGFVEFIQSTESMTEIIKARNKVGFCKLNTYSSAQAFTEFELKNMQESYLPGTGIDKAVLDLATMCDKTGRVEQFELTSLKQGYEYDMNSAFLNAFSQCKNIPDKWIKWNKDVDVMDENISYGFFLVKTNPWYKDVGAFPFRQVRKDATRFFYSSSIDECIIAIPIHSIRVAMKAGYPLDIVSGFYGYSDDKPFLVFANKIKELRKLLPGYGKMASGLFWGKFKSTSSCLYNPVISADIQDRVRSRLFEIKILYERHIKDFSLDGFSSDIEISGLEDFRLDYSGPMIILGRNRRYREDKDLTWTFDNKYIYDPGDAYSWSSLVGEYSKVMACYDLINKRETNKKKLLFGFTNRKAITNKLITLKDIESGVDSISPDIEYIEDKMTTLEISNSIPRYIRESEDFSWE